MAEDDDSKTPESELADDVLSIITVFGARLYGSRGKRDKGTKVRRSHGTKGATEGTAAELQNENVPDVATDQGVEDMVCSWAEGIQQGDPIDGERGSSTEHN